MGGTYYLVNRVSTPVTKESPKSTAGEVFTETKEQQMFSMDEVALHNSAESCYTVIRGFVYDLTSWIGQHPGGTEAILGICGHDGTAAFEGQHGGELKEEKKLTTFEIGVLAE